MSGVDDAAAKIRRGPFLRPGIAAAVVTLAVAAAAAPADAQTVALELGAARLRQNAPTESNVVTLGGEARLLGSGGSLGANALGAFGQAGTGTFQASAVSSLLRQTWIPGLLEMSAMATVFAATGQYPVSALQLFARQHHAVGAGGVYFGGGGGRSAWAGETLPVGSLQAGGWWRSGADQLTAATTLTLTQSEFRTGSGESEVRTVFNVRYADASASWQRSLARTRIGASAGLRFGIVNVGTSSGWVAASATRSLTDRVALTAAAGRSPADFVRGVPAARYMSLSLRAHSRERRVIADRDRTSGPQLTITTSENRRVVRVSAPMASRVELMADFTDWQPVALDRAGMEWVVEREMSPGIHRVLIRIDGGDWIVPSNLTRARDEFGGWVGLITVL